MQKPRPNRARRDRLRLAARSLGWQLQRYLEDDPVAAAEAAPVVEPLLRSYAAKRMKRPTAQEELAGAAWQIWLRNGQQLTELIDGVERRRKKLGLPALAPGETERADFFRELRACFSHGTSPGRPRDELTQVARIYRLIAGLPAEARGGVRGKMLKLIEETRVLAEMNVRGQIAKSIAEAEFIDTTEYVTRKKR